MIYFRSGDVCHHCDYPDAVLRDQNVRHSRTALADRMHTYLCAVLCQILHHRSYSSGGGCARGVATGCHHIIGLLRKGESKINNQYQVMLKNAPVFVTLSPSQKCHLHTHSYWQVPLTV